MSVVSKEMDIAHIVKIIGDNSRYYSDLEYLQCLKPRGRNDKNDNKA